MHPTRAGSAFHQAGNNSLSVAGNISHFRMRLLPLLCIAPARMRGQAGFRFHGNAVRLSGVSTERCLDRRPNTWNPGPSEATRRRSFAMFCLPGNWPTFSGYGAAAWPCVRKAAVGITLAFRDKHPIAGIRTEVRMQRPPRPPLEVEIALRNAIYEPAPDDFWVEGRSGVLCLIATRHWHLSGGNSSRPIHFLPGRKSRYSASSGMRRRRKPELSPRAPAVADGVRLRTESLRNSAGRIPR